MDNKVPMGEGAATGSGRDGGRWWNSGTGGTDGSGGMEGWNNCGDMEKKIKKM